MSSRKSVHGIRDFNILFLGRVLSTMSLQTQAVIVGWHIYELTKSPLMLGLIGLAEAVPAISFAFVSGHVVDHRRPAMVYRLCLAVLVLNAILIWSTTFSSLPFSSDIRLCLLFAGVFISGVVRSFTAPSVFAMISHVVPKHLMAAASAWNSSAFQMAAILGPALGGLVYGHFGAFIAFSIPPLLMLATLALQPFFTPSTKAMKSDSVREPFFASVRAGIRFVRSEKVLLSSMTLDMFSVLFGGAVAILPMFADQILHSGSEGLGYLRAAPSIGSGLIALLLAVRPMRVISGRLLLWVVAGFGLCILGFGLAREFWVAFACLAFSGAFDGVSMVIRNTLLQLLTPSNMRGRISSLSLIFITSSNEIGAFESGLAARVVGLIPSILFGGAMTLMVVSGTSWLSPQLRRTRLDPSEDSAHRGAKR